MQTSNIVNPFAVIDARLSSIETMLLDLKTQPKTTAPELRLYNSKETAKKLGISLPTLIKYRHEGLIKGRRIGTSVRFTEEDIQTALTEIPSQKYQRR
ncbi:MAG: helix-turn-helix domain-containing protein [Deltaproteobacteria bacterium]|nr:helix-turn-helix domain-containing protein [Deltaproteobacteria bacterium]